MQGNPMSKPRELFVLTLTPVPWEHRDTRPGIVRLRGALKVLLRSFGLKCLDIDYPKELPTEDNTQPDQDPAGA
jgi:hypothetical protein